MTTSSAPHPDHWAHEMAATFHELQRDTIRLFIPGLFLASILLWSFVLTASSYYWAMATGAGLLLLVPLLWSLAQNHFLAAAWLIIVGLSAGVMAAMFWGGIGPAVTLLLLPVGVAVLTMGARVGISLAACFTLLLLYLMGEQDTLIRQRGTLALLRSGQQSA